MNSKKPARRHQRARERDIRLDDMMIGPDADDIFGEPGMAAGDHKLIQLCRQVEEALTYALAGSRDPVLRDLVVVAVVPLRGAAALSVEIDPGDRLETAGDIERKLVRAKGYLRSEIAAGISRKRVPDLSFIILPPEAWSPEEGAHD